METLEKPVTPLALALETEGLDMQARLTVASQQEAVLTTRLQPEVLLDNADFERQAFTVADGVTVVFRQREELPLFTDEDKKVTRVTSETRQTTGQIDDIQAPQRPIRTSGDDYGDWLAETTGGDIWGDPFAAAAEDDKDVRFVVTSDPVGLVDGTLKLIETGVLPGDEQTIDRLRRVRGKLFGFDLDEEATEVVDMVVAASLVKLDDDPNGVAMEYGEHSEQGLVEVIQALSGDEQAKEILRVKQQVVKARDMACTIIKYERTREWVAESQPGAKLAERPKMPDEKLNPDELGVLADAHLVFVHTTVQDPQKLAGVIAPTSAYMDGYDRQTVHGSLNHTVGNVLFNDFSNRPFTVIARMEDLAEINSAPRNLNSVDTWFMPEAGSGLVVPPSATVLEVAETTDTGEALVFLADGRIQLQKEPATARQFNQILDGLASHYGLDRGRVVARLAGRHTFGNYFGENTYRIESQRQSGERISEDYPDQASALQERFQAMLDYDGPITEVERAVAGIVGFDMSAAGSKGLHEVPGLAEAFETLVTNDKLLAQCPRIGVALTDSLRRCIVDMEIERMNGDVQVGGQWGTNNAFDSRVRNMGLELGIPIGIHYGSDDYRGERAVYQAIDSAETVLTANDGGPVKDELGAGRKASYDWRKYDSQPIWEAIISDAPAARRLAIARGHLGYGHRRPPVLASYFDSGPGGPIPPFGSPQV